MLKSQPPFCLDYRARNRPQLSKILNGHNLHPISMQKYGLGINSDKICDYQKYPKYLTDLPKLAKTFQILKKPLLGVCSPCA